VDVVTTGTLLGVGPADSPDHVTKVLGPDFAEDTSGDRSVFVAFPADEAPGSRDT
jgi:hypothetical protein